MFNKSVWNYGEDATCEYLKNNGYKILYRNFKTKNAEIDIVAKLPKKLIIKQLKEKLNQDLKNPIFNASKKLFKQNFKIAKKQQKDLLVIVEVKSRIGDKFGTGLEAVDKKKQQKIKKGAEQLLLKKNFAKMLVRFDISSVDDGKITYYENAF